MTSQKEINTWVTLECQTISFHIVEHNEKVKYPKCHYYCIRISLIPNYRSVKSTRKKGYLIYMKKWLSNVLQPELHIGHSVEFSNFHRKLLKAGLHKTIHFHSAYAHELPQEPNTAQNLTKRTEVDCIQD